MKALLLGAATAGFTTLACLGAILAVQGKSYHFAMLLPVFAVFFLLIAWLLYLKQDRLLGKSSQGAVRSDSHESTGYQGTDTPDRTHGSGHSGRPGNADEPGGFAGQLPVTLYADLRDTLVSRSTNATTGGNRNTGQQHYGQAESPGQESGYGYGQRKKSGSGYGSGKDLGKLPKGILRSMLGDSGTQPVAILLWAAGCTALVSVLLYFLTGTGSRYFLP